MIEANLDDMTPQNFAYVTDDCSKPALWTCSPYRANEEGTARHLLQVLSPVDRSDALSHYF